MPDEILDPRAGAAAASDLMNGGEAPLPEAAMEGGMPPEAAMEGGMPPEAATEGGMPPEGAAVPEVPEVPVSALPDAPAAEPQGSIVKEVADEAQVIQEVGEEAVATPPEDMEAEYRALRRSYHEAIAYGAPEDAERIADEIEELQYVRFAQRYGNQMQAEKANADMITEAENLASQFPELQDPLVSAKVIAVTNVYREQGVDGVTALKSAVADFGFTAEAPVTEALDVPEEAAAAEEAVSDAATEGIELPEMEDRKLQKRTVSAVPSANMTNEPVVEPELSQVEEQAAAVAEMKKARGQI